MFSQSLQMAALVQWDDAAATAVSEGRYIGFFGALPPVQMYRATRQDGSNFFFHHSRVFNVALAFANRCAVRDRRPLACLTNTETGESHIL